MTDKTTARKKAPVSIALGLVAVGFKIGAKLMPELDNSMMREVMAAVNNGVQAKEKVTPIC